MFIIYCNGGLCRSRVVERSHFKRFQHYGERSYKLMYSKAINANTKKINCFEYINLGDDLVENRRLLKCTQSYTKYTILTRKYISKLVYKYFLQFGLIKDIIYY